MATIAQAQRAEDSLRRQFAAQRFYRRAKRYQRIGVTITLLLALSAPLVLFRRPGAGPALGAVAGVWIFASRLTLTPLRDRARRKGAAAQERFDCAVLSLPTNRSLGAVIADEEVRQASKKLGDGKSVRDWYPAEGNIPWPTSVLTCQRSNAVWARRQHYAYGWLLVIVAVGWAFAGVGMALLDEATLATYLTAIALPSLPALLDTSELARDHFSASRHREVLEQGLDELLDRGDATASELREVQDQLFTLRARSPLVPEWFYKRLAPSYEHDMRYAAGQRATED